MSIIVTNRTDNFNQWRVNTNLTSASVGDMSGLDAGITANTSLVGAVNELQGDIGTVALTTAAASLRVAVNAITDGVLTFNGAKTFSENVNLVAGKSFSVNSTSVLSATTLGSSVVSSSLTGLGTVSTGTWQASIVSPTYGGTGVNNANRTLTVSTGSVSLQAPVSGAAVILPASGTLATLAGTETLSGKSIALGSNTLSGSLAQFNTALTGGAVFASLAGIETLSNKTIALGSNTLSGSLAQFNAALTGGAAFASLAGAETLTNKTLTNPTINALGGVLVFPGSSAPAQTVTGSVVWDTSISSLTVGTGSTRKVLVNSDRLISTSLGITGGGDLSTDRPLALTGQALSLHSLATPGIFTRTGAGVITSRVMSSGLGVTVSNGAGDTGNPTFSIGQDVATTATVTFGSVTANSVRLGATANTLDTVSGNLTLNSTGGTTIVDDILKVTVAAPITSPVIVSQVTNTHADYTSQPNRFTVNSKGDVVVYGDLTVSGVTTLTSTTYSPAWTSVTGKAYYGVIKDGTNTATPANNDTTGDTLWFRSANGVTVTVGSNDGTFGDNILFGLSAVPNASLANSSVTIGSTTLALGASSATLAGLTTVTSSSFVGALTGNAATASVLQTARLLNGVSFNGSSDITLTAVNPNALTIGTGLTGGSYVGSGPVTIGIDSSVVALKSDTQYVGTTPVSLSRASGNLALTGISSITLPGSSSGSVQIVPASVAGTGTVITLPAASGTLLATSDVGSVTNNMLFGSIANSKLVNSSLTVTAGAGMSGGGSVALGGSLTLTNSGVLALTGGAGIGVSASTGSVTLTNSDPGSGQNIFKNVAVSGQSPVIADNNNDTLTLIAGSNIVITTDALNDAVTISGVAAAANNGAITISAGTGMSGGGSFTVDQSSPSTITLTNSDPGSGQNIWKNIVVAGQPTLSAGGNNASLTLVAGQVSATNGLTIATNSTTNTVTLAHADTSSLASTSNSGGVVVNNIGLDTYGHVVTAGSTDLDSRYLRPATPASVTTLTTSGDATVGGNLTVTGNITVNGTTTTLNTTTLDVADLNITLAKGALTAGAADGAGLTINGAGATMLYASASDRFVFNKNLQAASFVGALTGNSTTASAWATPRTITLTGPVTGTVSIDGSSAVSFGTTIAGGAVLLGTHTSGAYIGSVSGTSGRISATVPAPGGASIVDLVASGATAGSYGSASTIPVFSVDAFGRITTITTTSVVSANDGLLTMSVSGVGLSGSATHSANQSTASTFTVTSNATSANTASTIVARDGSGNFTAGAITATSFNATSSQRYKTNIATIENPIELVKNLRGVRYDRSDMDLENDIGVIAEEVHAVLPTIVSLNAQGEAEAVDYGRLSAVLIESVKNILTRLEKLEATVYHGK